VKPFSQACENNKAPILAVLERVFADTCQVLEIGSGTGQHAAHFAPRLPHLNWQTSDLAANHPGINAWIDDSPATNLARPLALDVMEDCWPAGPYDGFYSANTCHIMPWQGVVALFAGLDRCASGSAVLALYGPFKYGGAFTTPSNAAFDRHLREFAPHQGIRDIEAVVEVAASHGFALAEDNPLPANNQLVVFLRGKGQESRGK
jgi:hypothetical protein